LTDTDGTAKITDCGYSLLIHALLKRLDKDKVYNDDRCFWIAPENVRCTSVDINKASDVWGIGALTLELVTGKPPFYVETGGNVDELHKILKKREGSLAI